MRLLPCELGLITYDDRCGSTRALSCTPRVFHVQHRLGLEYGKGRDGGVIPDGCSFMRARRRVDTVYTGVLSRSVCKTDLGIGNDVSLWFYCYIPHCRHGLEDLGKKMRCTSLGMLFPLLLALCFVPFILTTHNFLLYFLFSSSFSFLFPFLGRW
jgi:hypothetical protein